MERILGPEWLGPALLFWSKNVAMVKTWIYACTKC
jgi:hypothetical protein